MVIESPATPGLVIAELKWRTRAPQQRPKALLPLLQATLPVLGVVSHDRQRIGI
jgi:hypothetical protein